MLYSNTKINNKYVKRKAGDTHIYEQHLHDGEGGEHGDIEAWCLQFNKFMHD